MGWGNEYPHKVYASVLLLDGKVVDYKIGKRYWKEPYDITLRGQASLKDVLKGEIKHTYWEVNNRDEHNNIFNKLAMEWINNQGGCIDES